MGRQKNLIILIVVVIVILTCAHNIIGARYYRLLEHERRIFLGLRAIDSAAAMDYLTLELASERRALYNKFWDGKDEERIQFEERVEYAFKNYGRNAPLSDDRLPTYVKYGAPTKRQEITPQKMIAITAREVVRPAEIWTYKKDGIEFDFIRIARAYKILVQTEFGDRVKIPYLREDTCAVPSRYDSSGTLDYDVAVGRFRQRKNLTRLEIYINLNINNNEDTTGLRFLRNIMIFNQHDSVVIEKRKVVVPENAAYGHFYDEINFWLSPELYKIVIELVDLKNNLIGKKKFNIDLLEYSADAKEISDLISATQIDEAFTDERFNKPVGRVIPMTKSRSFINKPFYFYHEVYNLEMKDGRYQLRTQYEIYNKEKMRKEIVDVLIQDAFGDGDVAYLAAKYHPMDLPAGTYIVVARDRDLLNGRERSIVGEFELLNKDNAGKF